MEEGIKITKPTNDTKSEQLANGIMICVGSYNDFGPIGRNALSEQFSEQLENVHNVNFYDSPDILKKKNFLGEQLRWTISTVDNFNKFSEKLLDCTALVVVGKDKTTGENISFISHQNPFEILNDKIGRKFNIDLKKRLTEIKERCKAGSISATIVAGKYPKKNMASPFATVEEMRKDYLDSIELISNEIELTLELKPTIFNGPKFVRNYDNIYFDNEKMRLYLMRPEVNFNIESFSISDIDKEKKKWDKD